MPSESTITPATKINLGILFTLLGSFVGAVFFLSTLNANVEAVVDGQSELRKAIDRNTEQLANDGKSLAVVQSVVNRQADEINQLRQRIRDLERKD